MSKIFYKIIKSLSFGVIAVILITIGIDASEHYDNMSESILGRMIFGQTDRPCAEGMVFVATAENGFCVDIYEASPASACVNWEVNTQADTLANLNDIDCKPVSLSGMKPWRYVSQDQAVSACAKAGKRLPTNEEWFAAALGTPDKLDAWDENDCQVDNNWEEQPGKGGSGINCQSAAGAYDMIGNVWEWVMGAAKDGRFEGRELPKTGYVDSTDGSSLPAITNNNTPNENYYFDYFFIKHNGVRGMSRGGYWESKSDAGQYSVYAVSPPSGVGQGTGFRCVK